MQLVLCKLFLKGPPESYCPYWPGGACASSSSSGIGTEPVVWTLKSLLFLRSERDSLLHSKQQAGVYNPYQEDYSQINPII